MVCDKCGGKMYFCDYSHPSGMKIFKCKECGHEAIKTSS